MFSKIKNLINKYNFWFVIFFTIIIYSSNLYYDYSKDAKEIGHRNLLTSSDNTPSTFLPYILYKTGSFDFSSITFYLRRFDGGEKEQYFIHNTGTQKVSVYPVFPGIAAFPIYLPFLLLNKIASFDFHENILKILLLGRVTGIIYATIAVGIFYLILQKTSNNLKTNLLFIALFAFGTTMWSISSRGTWSHTITALLLSLMIYLIITKQISNKLIFLIGFLGGITTLNRPTGFVITGIFGLYILYTIYLKNKNIKSLIIPSLLYFLGNLPSLIFTLTYNTIIFGGPLNEGYAARNDLKWTTPILEGLFGNFFMPGKGLLAITPVFVLALIFIYKLFKDKNFLKEKNTFYRFLSLIFFIFLMFYSKWYAWWGGNTHGYRFFTDLTPILVLFSYEMYLKISKSKTKIFVMVLIAYSIFIQSSAVFYQKSRCVDEDMHRLGCIDFSYFENMLK